MKIAYTFPGQASQEVGMGMELKEKYSYIAELFNKASEVLGFDIAKLIESGPIEEMTKTENAQPAILLVSYAAFRVMERETSIKPDFLIGHSLGEYTALCAAESLKFEDAISLVRERGRLMQEACPIGEGAMAAVMGLTGFNTGILIDKARNGDVLDLANYNAPGQFVISGAKGAVERACEIAPTLDAKKCVILNVSAPFHSKLMEPAAEKFAAHLEKVEFIKPAIPVIANCSAEPYLNTTEIRPLLAKQIDHPVLYMQSIQYLLEQGVKALIEVGPGKVLTGLNKRIAPKDSGITVASFGKPDNLEQLSAIISGGATDA